MSNSKVDNKKKPSKEESQLFLPLSRADLDQRGWDECDIILITGDAYIDHPSYGASIIGRVLEKNDYRVGIIAQPDWHSIDDFTKLGQPRLFFGITAGNIDSMVAHYTSNKKKRSNDEYSPGNKAGLRPDRACIVYANKVRQAFKQTPIVLGGIEASLRRFAHYDYWEDSIRRSILLDSRATILVYGMGERQILEIANRLNNGDPPDSLLGINGTATVAKAAYVEKIKNESIELPSFEEVSKDHSAFNNAFLLTYRNMDSGRGKPILQKHGTQYVVQYPPALPLSTQEIDQIYDLPFARAVHPSYEKLGGVPGFETVRFSITSHRGCCGSCSFCSLHFHHGRIVQSRSQESIIREIELLTKKKYFKGTITDIGGPTANMYGMSCPIWKKNRSCSDKSCLIPNRCNNLLPAHDESILLFNKIKMIPGVKHTFIGSGIRFDLLNYPDAAEYLEQIYNNHISGILKLAPEHCCDDLLALMGKPDFGKYEQFVSRFMKLSATAKKKIFIVNYFISGHPGATLRHALKLALYLAKKNIKPEQVQDFLPSPMTRSTCMYYTGYDPLTQEKVYVPKSSLERAMQRALLQYYSPANKKLVLQALKKLNEPELEKVLLPKKQLTF